MNGFSLLPEHTVALLLVFTALLVVVYLYRMRLLSRVGRQARAYEIISESAGDAFFEIDAVSRRMHWRSGAGLGKLSLDPDRDLQLGTDLTRVHPDDRDVLRATWDRLAHGKTLDIQLRIAESGGSWSWFHLNVAPLKDRTGRCKRAIGVIRYTNDLHQHQEALAEARRLESVGTIAGGIAHEFNNHLTPVRGYLELALDDLPPDNPSVPGLRTALERVVHCSELVSQIQAYGRKSLLVLRPVNLAAILPETVRIGVSMDWPNIQTVSVREDWPDSLPEVLIDKAQFQQGLHHLMRNAYEAMPEGGQLTVRAREILMREAECHGKPDAHPGRYICIEVTDTGHGIREEHVGQVMDPFFTTHGRARARGMGLPMVQGMMAQHGGWTAIHTEVGAGTKVRLYFPLAQPPQPGTGAGRDRGKEEALAAARTETRGRMLIADDEVFVRDLVRRLFEKENWEITEAASHEEVIEKLRQENPTYHVVILDLTMPGPAAEDTIAALRTKLPNTQILVTSGFNHNERVDRITRARGVSFIPKPFSTKSLLEKVDTILALPV